MREIKFRAWSIDTKEMLPWEEFMAPEWFEDDAMVPMQSMGKTDEDGKEIYEGDILAITAENKQDILVICRFGTIQRRMDTGFLCDITGFYFERSDGLSSLPIVKNYKGKHDLEMMQIVGNIYETPNLFKQNDT